MASQDDLHLLGIGYRHVKGGEDEFAAAGSKIKASGKEAAEGVGALDHALESVKDSVHDAVAEAAALVAAYVSIHAAIDGVLEGVKLFAEFDKGMAQLRALTQAGAGDLELFSERAKEIGASTIFGASQAVAGMVVLSKAGEDTAQVLRNMPAIEHLAVIGHEDLAAAADDAALTLHRFNLAADDAGHVVDVLAKLTTGSRAGVGDLVDVMKQAGPAAGAMGLKLEDTAAALGVMAQQGGNARASGSALVNVLAVLSNPTKQVQNDLKILGLTIGDLSPRTHSLTQILEQFQRVGLDAGSAFALFGHQGGAAILQLTQNLPALQKMLESLNDVDGASERLATTMEDNLGSSGERLSKVMEAVKLSIGEGLAPALAEVSKGMQGSLRDWQSGAEAFGHAMGTALTDVVALFVLLVDHGRDVKAVLLGMAVAAAALGITPLVASFWALVGAETAAVFAENLLIATTLALEAVLDSLSANPVMLVAVALGLLVAAIYEVVSANNAAAESEAAFQKELADGRPKVEGLTYAHAELAKRLREEIELRAQLSTSADRLASRYEALAAVEARMTADLQTGNVADYQKAIEQAQRLGVVISGLGKDHSGLEAVGTALALMGKQVEATATKAAANNERISSSQRQLKENVVQALDEEYQARLTQLARIAALEAKKAQAAQELSQYQTGAIQANQVQVLDMRDPVASMQKFAAEIRVAQAGLTGINAELVNMRGNAADAMRGLFSKGDYDAAARVAHQLGLTDAEIQDATAHYREYNAQVAAEAAKQAAAKKAEDDRIASMREQARLYADEIKAAAELTRTLTVEIAGHRSVAAAYGVSVAAGLLEKQRVEEVSKATQASAKFTGERRAAIYALTIEQIHGAQVEAVAAAAAGLRLEVDKKLAESRAKVTDVVNGNTLASTAAATAAEVEDFRVKNLMTTTDKRIINLKLYLAQRDKLLQQNAQEAISDQLALDFATARRTAEAALTDAMTGTTKASQDLVVQLEIEARIRSAGANDDAKKKDSLAAEIIGRHAVTDSLATQKTGADALRASYAKLDDLQAGFADSQKFRHAVQEWGTDIAGILQKYGLLSDATKALAIQREALIEFNSAGNTKTLDDLVKELTLRQKVYDVAAKGAAETEIAQLKADQMAQSLATAFGEISTALGGASTSAGRLAAGLGDLISSLGKLGSAGKAWSADWTSAMVGAIAAAGALIKELNIGGSNKSGGPQALGGKLDGNYSGIGAIVGTVVGAIIAAIVSDGSATGGGAAIGAALGGVLGAMISKAGDSASAQLTAGGNVIIGESSKQLDGAVSDALHKIFQGLQAVFASLGLLFQGAPLIDIKVRDNIVRVIVGNVVRTFSTMQDAISFAIAEALKQTATGGHLPPEVIAALKNTTATDMQSLQSDIDFAFSIANVGVPKVVQAIDKSVSDFYVAMQRAVALGIDTGKVVQMFAEQIQAQKDSILQTPGKSPADQMRADAAAFNQKMELLKANELADLADLGIKRTDLEAKIALLKLSGSLTKDQLQQIADAQAALGAIDQAIAAAQGVLASIVEISDKELADALARLGKGGSGGSGGGGTSLAQTVADAARQRELSQLSAFGQALAAINDKWDKAIADAHLHSNALAEVTKQHEAAILAAHGNADAIKAANAKYAEQLKHIKNSQEAIAAANAERQKEIDLLRQQAALQTANDLKAFETNPRGTANPWDAQLGALDQQRQSLEDEYLKTAHDLGWSQARIDKGLTALNKAYTDHAKGIDDAAIASLNLPMEGTRKGVADLTGTINYLRDSVARGTLSVGRFNEVMGEVGDQATVNLLGQAAALLEQEGKFDEADKARRMADKLNFELQKLQFNFLLDSYEALGILTGKQKDDLEALRHEINDSANQPDFSKPAPQRASNNVATGGSTSSAASADDARRQAILDQITAWNKLGDPAVTSQLRDLNATFVSMKADAARLGVSLSDLQGAYGNAVKDFWDKALAPYEQSDNLIDKLAEINKTFNDMIAGAQQWGGDQARIEADRQKAIQKFWDDALQPIKDLQAQLHGGQLGGVSPEGKLLAAQQRFNDLAAKALTGDSSAIQALPQAVQDLLEQQKAFSGTGPAYQALVATIQHVLAQVLALGTPGAAGQPPATVTAGLPPAPAGFAALPGAAPTAPRPLAPPAPPSAGKDGGSAPPDARFDQLVNVVQGDVQARQDDRNSIAALRAQVDRLVRAQQDQSDRVDQLVATVRTLTGFIEKQALTGTNGSRLR